MRTVPDTWLPMLEEMRRGAADSALGAFGFYAVVTRSRGSVPVWYEDIKQCGSDEELVELILRSIK